MKSIAPMILAIALSGCLTGAEPRTQLDSNLPDEHVTIDLDWIPEGMDFIVLKLTSAEGQNPLFGNLGGGVFVDRSTEPLPGVCFPVSMAGARSPAPFFQPELQEPLSPATQPGISYHGNGQSVHQEVRALGSGIAFAGIYLSFLEPGVPAYMTFGISDADFWKENESDLHFVLKLNTPTRVDVVHTGRIDCRMDLSQADQGDYLATSLGVLGSDLVFDLTPGPGVLMSFAMTDELLSYDVGNGTRTLDPATGDVTAEPEFLCGALAPARVVEVEGVQERFNRLDLMHVPLPEAYWSAFDC